ncbi:hypothetical protein BH09VER1_BH09VER1_16170 [soil metagenome]
MSETRTILGFISHPTASRSEIAFPEVRAWIEEPGKVLYRPGAHHFPETGTVYLHAAQANDTTLVPGSYALFHCKISERSARSGWAVSKTDDSLCQVVTVSAPLTNPPDLYAELEAAKYDHFAKVLLGSGRVYVLTSDGWILGPYSTKDKVLVPTDRMLRYKKDSVDLLELGKHEFSFISTRALGTGIVFPPTLPDAVRRILRLLLRQGRCDFLSRPRIAELAAELADTSVGEELSWFVGTLNQLLPQLKNTLETSEELFNQLLSNKAIADGFDARWKATHAEKVGLADSQLKATEDALAKSKKEHQDLLELTSVLALEADELKATVGQQQEAARDAFKNEVARLTADPTQLAIFASLLTSTATPIKTPEIVPVATSPWHKVSVSDQSGSPSLNGEEIIRRLLVAGLSARCARDLAIVGVASFDVGQVISIKSPVAALIADSLLIGSGHKSYHACEVSAGLLDPIPHHDSQPTNREALLFHGGNRSDYNLVLADYRFSLLEQLIPGNAAIFDVVLTLDSVEGMVVQQPLLIGPSIGPDFLTFADNPASQTVNIKGFPARAPETIGVTSPEDFEQVFGEWLRPLNCFRDSFIHLMARRFFAALKPLAPNESERKILFLKYWLIPRLLEEELLTMFKAEAEIAKADLQIKTLRARLGNE